MEVDRYAFENGWASFCASCPRLADAVCDHTMNLSDLGPPEFLRAVYVNEIYLKRTRKPSLWFSLSN